LKQNFGLDLVRAGSILAVLFAHTTDWWLAPGQLSDIRGAAIGGAGVEAFFSLSGFLIGGILLQAVERGLGPAALGRFWTRRWMRTLPAYWVMLLLLGWHFEIRDWRSLLFLQNFSPRSTWMPLTPHTWSLVLEEWFYLWTPVALLVTVRLLGHARRQWAMPAVCVALLLLCSIGRWTVGAAPNPIWGPEPPINPILRLDCAAWGVLAVWCVRRWEVPRWAAGVMAVVGVALMLLLIRISILAFFPERLLPWGYLHWVGAWVAMHASLEGLAAAFIAVGLYRLLPRGTGPGAWLFGAIARLSYALYLVHIPVLFLARGAGLDDGHGWGTRLTLMALVVGVALAVRYGVELPVLALRDALAPDSVGSERRGRPVIKEYGTGSA
jgi:peptidoglycan/LPS O-acetylase OafA/YrhL